MIALFKNVYFTNIIGELSTTIGTDSKQIKPENTEYF